MPNIICPNCEFSIVSEERGTCGCSPNKMVIVNLAGEDLRWFKKLCEDMTIHGEGVWSVQVGIDAEGVKFKVDFGTWTPGKGQRE